MTVTHFESHVEETLPDGYEECSAPGATGVPRGWVAYAHRRPSVVVDSRGRAPKNDARPSCRQKHWPSTLMRRVQQSFSLLAYWPDGTHAWPHVHQSLSDEQ